MEDKDVDGQYIFNSPYGLSVLILRKNGVYVQIVNVESKEDVVVHEGRWRLKSSTLYLENPIVLTDPFGVVRKSYREPVGRDLGMLINKKFGILRLVLNPDQGFEYKKLN